MSHDQLGRIDPDRGFGLGFGVDGVKAPLRSSLAGVLQLGRLLLHLVCHRPEGGHDRHSMAQLHPTGGLTLEAVVQALAYQSLSTDPGAP